VTFEHTFVTSQQAPYLQIFRFSSFLTVCRATCTPNEYLLPLYFEETLPFEQFVSVTRWIIRVVGKRKTVWSGKARLPQFYHPAKCTSGDKPRINPHGACDCYSKINKQHLMILCTISSEFNFNCLNTFCQTWQNVRFSISLCGWIFNSHFGMNQLLEFIFPICVSSLNL